MVAGTVLPESIAEGGGDLLIYGLPSVFLAVFIPFGIYCLAAKLAFTKEDQASRIDALPRPATIEELKEYLTSQEGWDENAEDLALGVARTMIESQESEEVIIAQLQPLGVSKEGSSELIRTFKRRRAEVADAAGPPPGGEAAVLADAPVEEAADEGGEESSGATSTLQVPQVDPREVTEEQRPQEPLAPLLQDRKPCPFCAESIKVVAKKCRFCGEWLVPENERPSIDA